jgi:intracellular septation protein
MSPALKFVIEAGPLITFFAANWWGGIFWATGVFMVATAIALAASWALTRKFAVVPLIGAVFVAIFGGLTLWLQDDMFIKIKVTLINGLFACILLGGLFFGQTFLKYVMGEAIRMTDEGWRTLTIRWGMFFFAMAALNEVIWRTQSNEVWINFKVFGLLALTFGFAISQGPFMAKHMIEDKPEAH